MTSQIRVDSIVPTTGVPTGGGGGIVQVVQGTTQTDVAVSTQNTYTDTTLEATITPLSASNKIFVIVNQFLYSSGSGGFSIGGAIRVVRNPGNNFVYIPKTNDNGPIESYMLVNYGGSYPSMGFFETKTITFLDSPTTTDPITYNTQGSKYTSYGTMSFNYGGVGSGANVSDSTSYITLMEVSA